MPKNPSINKAMNTQTDIEGLSVVYPDAKYIVVITEKGKINKFPIHKHHLRVFIISHFLYLTKLR